MCKYLYSLSFSMHCIEHLISLYVILREVNSQESDEEGFWMNKKKGLKIYNDRQHQDQLKKEVSEGKYRFRIFCYK